MTIQASPAVREALRAVSDSFVAREAIQVRFVPLTDTMGSLPVTIAPSADLVVVTGELAPRLPSDSLWWYLPFAELLVGPADTAAADTTDRQDRGATAPARQGRRVTRRTTGRIADSIRADSARRATALADSLRAARARADSARILVFTVPADAANGAVAERFVRYMLTEGRPILLRTGAQVLPRLVLRGENAPLAIRSLVDTVTARDAVVPAPPLPPR